MNKHFEMQLGILGGGQLAQLMCQAAQQLGVHCIVYSPDRRAPAARQADTFICAEYTDINALRQFGQQSDVITLDNEHIPYDAQVVLSDLAVLHPGLDTMSRIRDRLAQRGLLMQLNLPQTRFWSIDKAVSVHAAQHAAQFPAVLKSRLGGYDGYGQRIVSDATQLPAAWEALGHRPCILEGWVNYLQEFSIVGARNSEGITRMYEPIKNTHQNGQLQRSDSLADLSPVLVQTAQAIWRKIANALNYQGVMTVEFFLDNRKQILVNEIAPRVHNSGHVTQMAYDISQFELHIRGVLGQSMPALQASRKTTMFNLYPEHGTRDSSTADLLQIQLGGQIYWYGKSPKPRRKMGHWLVASEQAEKAQQLLNHGLKSICLDKQETAFFPSLKAPLLENSELRQQA